MALSKDNKPARVVAFYIFSWTPSLGSSISLSNLKSLFAIFQTFKHSKNNFQQVFKTVLKSRAPTLRIFITSWEISLKINILYIYRDDFHIECYNCIQPYKNHFITSRAKSFNQFLFITTFLKNQALFKQQQYKYKMKTKILVSIYWDNFKIFLYYSLKEFRVFINSI